MTAAADFVKAVFQFLAVFACGAGAMWLVVELAKAVLP